MNKYYPSYYKNFLCSADKCPDSCCKSWEIVIDDETYSRYLELKGAFGEKIRSFITTDKEGDRCFMLQNNRCPFLNENNLCDIHILLGEELTSEVCRLHPRFIEEYDGFTEISLSLSCPEAASLITSAQFSPETYPVPEYKGDDEVLSILISSRKELLNEKLNAVDFINKLTAVAARDEMLINSFIADSVFIPSVSDIKKYIARLGEQCEILCDSWKERLIRTEKGTVSDKELYDFISDNEKQFLNISRYFVYRYYLKAVNDLDVYSRALFIIYSVFTAALIAVTDSISVTEAARLYSKETEHSTENIDIIIDGISEY